MSALSQLSHSRSPTMFKHSTGNIMLPGGCQVVYILVVYSYSFTNDSGCGVLLVYLVMFSASQAAGLSPAVQELLCFT